MAATHCEGDYGAVLGKKSWPRAHGPGSIRTGAHVKRWNGKLQARLCAQCDSDLRRGWRPFGSDHAGLDCPACGLDDGLSFALPRGRPLKDGDSEPAQCAECAATYTVLRDDGLYIQEA